MSGSKGEIKRLMILKAIYSYYEQHNSPPSVNDIRELTEIRSFNTITRHLKKLHHEDLINWEDGMGNIEIKTYQHDIS